MNWHDLQSDVYQLDIFTIWHEYERDVSFVKGVNFCKGAMHCASLLLHDGGLMPLLNAK
jgi:hypothetical protein